MTTLNRHITRLALGAALTLSVAGCDSLLNTEPPTQVPDQTAIVNAGGARAALIGAYASLTHDALYGGDLPVFNDLYADNARHSGTFPTYADAGAYRLRAENGDVARIWRYTYITIDRVNRIIEKVPELSDLSDAEKADIIGQARALRALSYHNLVRSYGGVPLVLVTPSGPDEASQITRATVDEVYTQITTDLEAASSGITTTNTNRITAGAVLALLARIHLYREQWAQAVARANQVEARGYDLASSYEDLFPATATETSEEIFKVYFDAANYQLLGWYYRARG